MEWPLLLEAQPCRWRVERTQERAPTGTFSVLMRQEFQLCASFLCTEEGL